MSSNVELVKAILANWERGDFGSADWADPAIEVVVPDGPVMGDWHGVEEMGAAWREVLNAYDDFRAIPLEVRELPDGRLLVITSNRGRGKASGIEVAEVSPRGANIFEVRDGKVLRLTCYWSVDRAMADLGLS